MNRIEILHILAAAFIGMTIAYVIGERDGETHAFEWVSCTFKNADPNICRQHFPWWVLL